MFKYCIYSYPVVRYIEQCCEAEIVYFQLNLCPLYLPRLQLQLLPFISIYCSGSSSSYSHILALKTVLKH